jgi:hypothetical protein
MTIIRLIKLALITSITTLTLHTSGTNQTIHTIFIHGVFNPKPHAKLGLVPKLFKDSTQNTVYTIAMSDIRKQKYQYDSQPIQDIGTHIVTDNSPHGARNWIKSYRQVDAEYRPQDCINRCYYTCGWSGIVSESERLKAAQKLYEYLQTLDGIIRIVAFSHGGDVANCLQQIHNKHPDSKFHIQELVTIGTPVIKNSYHAVNGGLFERYYHIFSKGDAVQKLDIVSENDMLFSQRNFKLSKKLPKNLVQVELQMAHYTKKGRKKIYKPGHVQLWFFGWKPRLARRHKSQPIDPFPPAIFVSCIINAVECAIKKGLNQHRLTVELDPTLGKCKIKDNNRRPVLSYPFCTNQYLAALQGKLEAKPEKPYWYKNIIPKARKKARKIKKELWRLAHLTT